MTVESAARAVLEGASSIYGQAWRSWATHPGATTQGQAFSVALLALEAALRNEEAHELAPRDKVIAELAADKAILELAAAWDRRVAAGQPRTLGRVAAKLRDFWTRRHRPTD